jgi:hypothetical protein
MNSVLSQSATGGNVCLSQEYALQKFTTVYKFHERLGNDFPDISQVSKF